MLVCSRGRWVCVDKKDPRKGKDYYLLATPQVILRPVSITSKRQHIRSPPPHMISASSEKYWQNLERRRWKQGWRNDCTPCFGNIGHVALKFVSSLFDFCCLLKCQYARKTLAFRQWWCLLVLRLSIEWPRFLTWNHRFSLVIADASIDLGAFGSWCKKRIGCGVNDNVSTIDGMQSEVY